MKLKQNIGMINALVRITCGFTMLSWATAKMVKKPWDNSFLVVAILAAMKIGEGIVRYCPVTDLCQQMQENNNKNDEQQETKLLPLS